MATSSKQTQSTTAFLWATFFTLFFLFLSGYGLISIIHFALEDAFLMPLSTFFATDLFGFEYATFLSWGLILSLIFLAGDLYTRYWLRHHPDLFADPVRRVLFTLFFALILYVFCTDLISIFYGFFSGRTGPFGLSLSISTLVLSVCILGYIYVQMYVPTFACSRAFSIIVVGFTACGMICGIVLTLAYAPPWIMAKADQDIKTLTFLHKTLPEQLKKYWSDYKTLPAKLDRMAAWKTVPSSLKDKITYTFYGPKQCTICAVLDVDPLTARRVRIKTDFSDNLSGKMCQSLNLVTHDLGYPSFIVHNIVAAPATVVTLPPAQTAHLSASTPPKTKD